MFPSPNCGPRRGGARPALVVLHSTGMATAAAARARLCDPAAAVSAHWLIDEQGGVEALVDEALRAWHAGAGEWQGQGDVNSRAIGIELANPGDRPFPARQIAALERLLACILERWGIPPAGVIAHSDMAPGRKVDPGPRLDWRGLARAGLSVWPWTPGDPDRPLADSLSRIGYPAVAPELRLAAFRLRFRPWARGDETAADRAVAAGLADRIDG